MPRQVKKTKITRLKPWNEERADWAQVAIDAFRKATRTDEEDALADLIGDLKHLSDRLGWDFDAQLNRADGYYRYELEHED